MMMRYQMMSKGTSGEFGIVVQQLMKLGSATRIDLMKELWCMLRMRFLVKIEEISSYIAVFCLLLIVGDVLGNFKVSRNVHYPSNV